MPEAWFAHRSSVGFLRAPFSDVVAHTLAWRNALASQWEQPQVGIAHHMRSSFQTLVTELAENSELLFDADGWTGHVGSDSVPWVGHLSRLLNTEGVIATCAEHSFPVVQLELLGPKGPPPLHYVRTISCGIFDSGRWSFETSGQVQTFEQIERYGARLKRDRFTEEMLVTYLRAMRIVWQPNVEAAALSGVPPFVRSDRRQW